MSPPGPGAAGQYATRLFSHAVQPAKAVTPKRTAPGCDLLTRKVSAPAPMPAHVAMKRISRVRCDRKGGFLPGSGPGVLGG